MNRPKELNRRKAHFDMITSMCEIIYLLLEETLRRHISSIFRQFPLLLIEKSSLRIPWVR